MKPAKKPIGSYGKLSQEPADLEVTVRDLIARARAKPIREDAFRADDLAGMIAAQQRHTVETVVSGWKVLATMVILRSGVLSWHVSASLHPMGRSSVEEDWNVLGRIIAASGAPIQEAGKQLEAQVKAGRSPNAPQHWMWREAAGGDA